MNQYVRFFLGTPLRAVCWLTVAGLIVLTIWSQFDEAGVARFTDHAETIAIRIGVTIGVVAAGLFCFRQALFPNKKGKGGNH